MCPSSIMPCLKDAHCTKVVYPGLSQDKSTCRPLPDNPERKGCVT